MLLDKLTQAEGHVGSEIRPAKVGALAHVWTGHGSAPRMPTLITATSGRRFSISVR